MNKKLGRVLRPNMAYYFLFLLVFPIAAFVVEQYMLALVGFGATFIALVVYLLLRNRRNKWLKKYIHNQMDQINGVKGSQSPFLSAVINLEDDRIVIANDAFTRMTDHQDVMKQRYVQDYFPKFKSDWLLGGKNESPFDIRWENRRFRVYGTVIQADDPKSSKLGVLHFADLTELYQVRDEYIRSRPVVSIILVDNYEELTKNLTESAISNLNAKINDAITNWTEGLHGMLRKLERNRYLLVFEKRDLQKAKDGKFS